MTAAGLRPESVKYYLRVLGYLKTFCTEASGPGDVTPARAQDWADHYATAPARCKKVRSGHTAVSVIDAVTAVFQKWLLDELKITSHNPFLHVKPPKTDKPEVMIASDEVLANFDRWLTERFGDWHLPNLFFAIKELTGCRVQDVCSLKSMQLREGRLYFPADVTKGRKARAVPLPADLFAALEATKGPGHLWESYPVGLKAVLERKSWPTHQLKLAFSPMRMVGWVMTIFADYNSDHPNAPRLKSHGCNGFPDSLFVLLSLVFQGDMRSETPLVEPIGFVNGRIDLGKYRGMPYQIVLLPTVRIEHAPWMASIKHLRHHVQTTRPQSNETHAASSTRWCNFAPPAPTRFGRSKPTCSSNSLLWAASWCGCF